MSRKTLLLAFAIDQSNVPASSIITMSAETLVLD